VTFSVDRFTSLLDSSADAAHCAEVLGCRADTPSRLSPCEGFDTRGQESTASQGPQRSVGSFHARAISRLSMMDGLAPSAFASGGGAQSLGSNDRRAGAERPSDSGSRVIMRRPHHPALRGWVEWRDRVTFER
jgi:hypothetical protein